MSINVLHICGGFKYSQLYTDFISELNQDNVCSEIIAPIFTKIDTDVKSVGNAKIHYLLRSKNFYERVFFMKKIRKIIHFTESVVDFSKINIIHAHTWYSDGFVAYFLSKKYNIPYIIAVRNSDVNVFHKYFIHLHCLSYKVLKNAKKIIFISHAYNRFFSTLIGAKRNAIVESKYMIIPNGVNTFWLKNINNKKQLNNKDIRLLYIGDFCKFKNIHTLFYACHKLRNEGYNISLTAVGKGSIHSEHKYQKQIEKIENTHSNFFRTIIRKNKNELLPIFEHHDIFIMLSQVETFGLVYAEALTQGLPIIYTAGQGFDQFYNEGEVGYSALPNDIDDVCKKIKLVINNYSKIVNFIETYQNDFQFNWQKIALTYKNIYENNSIA